MLIVTLHAENINYMYCSWTCGCRCYLFASLKLSCWWLYALMRFSGNNLPLMKTGNLYQSLKGNFNGNILIISWETQFQPYLTKREQLTFQNCETEFQPFSTKIEQLKLSRTIDSVKPNSARKTDQLTKLTELQ